MDRPFYAGHPAHARPNEAALQSTHLRLQSSLANVNQPRTFNNNNQGYLQNGGAAQPGAAPLLPNQGRVIQTGPMRVLCIADVRGNGIRPEPLPNLQPS